MSAARDLQQRLRAIDIHLAQQRLVPIQDTRRCSVDNDVRLDSAEDIQHGLDGGDVAVVVVSARQAVVGRAQVHDRYLGDVFRVALRELGVLETRVAGWLGQGHAGVVFGGEVQQLVDDVPA